MKFEFILVPNIPPLAWHASVKLDRGVCVVRHGRWVEKLGLAFVEGVWDGDFQLGGLDQSGNIFGSGGVLRDGGITFVSSAATTDSLYWRRQEDGAAIEVSNSLCFLLAQSEDALDSRCASYHIHNESIIHGIDRYLRDLRTVKGCVHRLLHRNLRIAPGSLEEIDKPRDPRFDTFADYYSYINAAYERIALNARDSIRACQMAIFSTQSKGYDSTAVNALASSYGVDRAFTVAKGKVIGRYSDAPRHLEPDDDGTEICGILKIPCSYIDKRFVESWPDKEYLVYSTTHDTGDLNLLEIGQHVSCPTVLLTGCLGEIWYTSNYYDQHPGVINDQLVRGDLGNHGLTEVRLQSGFVQLPIPFIGARSRADIYRITHSNEMTPWRLGTAYDRPIARRIAEEKGVPRHLFGQVKMASVLEFAPPAVPCGAVLRKEFFRFLVANGLLRKWQVPLIHLVRYWNMLIITASPRQFRAIYYLQRVLCRVLRRNVKFRRVWDRLDGAVFCFAANRRVRDYLSPEVDHG